MDSKPNFFGKLTQKLALIVGINVLISSIIYGILIFILRYNSPQAALMQSAILFFPLLVISCLLILPFSINLTKRIEKLTEANNLLKSGKYDFELGTHAPDELQNLTTLFISLAKNIESSKKNENEGQNMLAASIKSLPLGFIAFDMEKNTIINNEQIKKILNIDKDILFLDDLKGIFDKTISFDYMYKDLLDNKKTLVMDNHRYGSKILRLILSPITVNNDKVSGLLVIAEDITEARAKEKSKDEFFSIASHELRTPLTAIRGNLSMIQEIYGATFKDPELKQMLVDMHDSSTRLINIVNMFLDVKQNNLVYKLDKIDIIQILKESIGELKILADKKNIFVKIEPEFENKKFYVSADINKTTEIFVNIIGNAIRFTDIGGVTISLQEDPTNIKVLISDTGYGIPTSYQGLLFRQFDSTASGNQIKDNTKSSGLGLYISKLLAQGMGGDISLVSSVENKGSTFSVALPKAYLLP